MTAAAKLKKARETLDNRVVKYIRRYGVRGCRLMNLVCNHGTKKEKCDIPALVIKDFNSRNNALGSYAQREYIMIAALKRLKRADRIRCNKEGTPSWVAIPDGERAHRAKAFLL
jgi:hypothetical protein